MAFAIEVQGETNPLNPQNVLNTLVLAASSSQQQVRTGTEQLQNWEKQGMYYSFLQEVFLDHSVPNEVRHLAIIQLKNGIDKYWRKTAPNAIKAEEKEHIKTRALGAGIVEPAPLLALHNSLMIAKIMRFEFPHDCQARCHFVHHLLAPILRPTWSKSAPTSPNSPHIATNNQGIIDGANSTNATQSSICIA
ncbi:Armadillo-like helical [Penicillium verrucosum]|uniref:Armadillo-like helical n=1 Tax=Penicillium verrucosum TaxID=60171 RepID=UPI0025457332|nr:Armadillo-like helical [Penicillium verrucosum]KAJ5944280.1 Armadillo-like helical [Penicillium verrucosum]